MDFIKIVKFRFVIKMTSFDILLIISNFNLVGGGAIEERFILCIIFITCVFELNNRKKTTLAVAERNEKFHLNL